MSPPAANLGERQRIWFADAVELAKTHPDEVEAIVCSLVAHLRAWKPESVSPLGELLPPTEPNVDPRGVA